MSTATRATGSCSASGAGGLRLVVRVRGVVSPSGSSVLGHAPRLGAPRDARASAVAGALGASSARPADREADASDLLAGGLLQQLGAVGATPR